MEITLATFVAAIVAMAAPIILAALGETLSEKAGVVNLSLDGAILLSAMAGFVVAFRTHSLFLGFIAAAATGAMVAMVLAVVGVWLNQSQVAAGFALAFLCRDLAYFLGHPYSRQQGPQLATLPLPGLSDLPFFGQVLFSHSPVVYLSLIAIPGCLLFLYRSRYGLLLRCAGENPEACWARGINPTRVRFLAVIAGGVLVGLAGGAFSLAIKPGWGQPQGCEGIGWIALALVIFGGWRPLRVAMGAYLFGTLQLLGIYFQDAFPAIPGQIFQVAPFPLMIFTLILIHLGGKGRGRWNRIFIAPAPKWLGRAYKRV
jgi:general nucleoside transport system permease protein